MLSNLLLKIALLCSLVFVGHNKTIILSGQTPTQQVWNATSNLWNISSGPIRLNQTLIIPKDVHLTIDDLKFEFGPKGKIVVQPRAKLTLNNTILTGDPICQTMWHGIRVLGPGYGTVSTNSNAGQLIVSGTWVEDAVIGVAGMRLYDDNISIEQVRNDVVVELGTLTSNVNTAIHPDTLIESHSLGAIFDNALAKSTAGGIIRIDQNAPSGTQQSRFFNCFHGINLSWNNDAFFNNRIDILNTLFSSSGNLNAPFDDFSRTEIGLAAYSGNNIELNANTFQNVRYGIHLTESNQLNILGNDFTNCSIGISLRNYDANLNGNIPYNHLVTNSFSSCFIGVQTERYSFSASGNTFNNIGETHSTNMLVKASQFNIWQGNGSGIGNELNNAQHGIWLIDNTPQTSAIDKNSWLYIDRTLSTANPDSTNSVIQGNVFDETNYSIHALNNNTAVQMTCNHFCDYDAAIYIEGPTNSIVLADQGLCDDESTLPPGNIFAETPNTNANAFPQAIFIENNNGFTYYVEAPDPFGDLLIGNISSNISSTIENCQGSVTSEYCGNQSNPNCN